MSFFYHLFALLLSSLGPRPFATYYNAWSRSQLPLAEKNLHQNLCIPLRPFLIHRLGLHNSHDILSFCSIHYSRFCTTIGDLIVLLTAAHSVPENRPAPQISGFFTEKDALRSQLFYIRIEIVVTMELIPSSYSGGRSLGHQYIREFLVMTYGWVPSRFQAWHPGSLFPSVSFK